MAFHQVKKSPLIIGIVNRIKINSDQLLFANCRTIIYVCFVYLAVIVQVWINLHRQHEMYFIQ